METRHKPRFWETTSEKLRDLLVLYLVRNKNISQSGLHLFSLKEKKNRPACEQKQPLVSLLWRGLYHQNEVLQVAHQSQRRGAQFYFQFWVCCGSVLKFLEDVSSFVSVFGMRDLSSTTKNLPPALHWSLLDCQEVLNFILDIQNKTWNCFHSIGHVKWWDGCQIFAFLLSLKFSLFSLSSSFHFHFSSSTSAMV